MLSLIAGAALFVACLYGGAGIRRYYKVRSGYFEEINNLCGMLIDEIANLKTPLEKILENFTFLKRGEIVRQIDAYRTLLKTEVIASRESVMKVVDSAYLKKEEKLILTDFFMLLGRSHAESQIVNIKHYKLKFEEIGAKAKEAYRVQGALAYKLGILLGIALMIIVV
ncbi:MAG: stage III sporulation protein AB [Clostridiales bacterium]|nr:stage III sporulation protein AB [Clostridiales bacterium]